VLLGALAGCHFDHGQSGRDAAMIDAPPDAIRIDGPPSEGLPPVPIVFVQEAAFTNMGNHNTVATAFLTPEIAGDFNVAVVSWSDGSSGVMMVSDDQGNMYTAATTLLATASFSMRIYYATNVRAGATTVTARTMGNVPSPKLRVFEYSGVALMSPVDVTAAQMGVGADSTAGPITTMHARDLLFAANVVATVTTGAGPTFTERQLDGGDLVEERVVNAVGNFTATAPMTADGDWIMQLVAFKGQ